MEKILDTYDHAKLNQENTNHLHRSITSNKIEATIAFQKRKVQDPVDSLLNSTRPLKKN
jgi:hypothetical protein